MNEKTLKSAARIALGSALILAGISHLTFARKEFQAQVPDWVPLKKDETVVYSGVGEVALGTAIALAPKRQRERIGVLAAAFFVAVFPGNISQYTHHRTAFGLNTDRKRLARLFFQPALVAWAWWSTRKN
ncbi:MAG: DoxX family protein [Mucilaginibacter sp.]